MEFFESYFGKVRFSSKLLEIPIWGSDSNVSHANELSKYEFYDSSHHYFVFGGQLVPGRGLQVAMEAALLAAKIQPKIRLWQPKFEPTMNILEAVKHCFRNGFKFICDTKMPVDWTGIQKFKE